RSWAALNRIHDANPSLISGNVKADGHLYFVNGNGIIFGNGAQINVGSLTASTLDVTDDLFDNGILSDSTKAVFSGTGGFVRVEQGAALTAASGGRVMLLAKDVTNSGVITTPDGQTILAAGEKVYLADSADPAGLLVEVSAGGAAKNLGEIVAQRGNVTLVGLAVNQEGRISASTSVRANGSIHLLARDTVNAGGGMRYGKVVVGQASETVVSAETGDKEEVLDQQAFTPSRIRIEGRSIEVDGLIEARGGNVAVEAKSDASSAPAHTDPEFQELKNRVYLGEHARIDVSGLDATAPMSRHQLEIQLYSDQLKDSPLLRGGALFGEKIYVDARKGTPLTDIAPFLALKGRTVAEKLSQGGTVSLNASSLLDDPGGVIVRQGAVVDVSGGSITYQSGLIRESSLRYNGKLIPIAEATPDKIYQGTGETYSVTDPKWGVTRTWTMAPSPHGTMQQGYSDGSAAGSIRVAADQAALEGTFRANTRAGVFQREMSPDGGAFHVALNSAVRLVQDAWKLPAGFAATAALPVEQSGESQLGMGLLRSGFDDLDLKGGQITVDAAVRTSPKGSVRLAGGGGVAINADIVAPGGSIDIAGGEVRVANGVTLSTAGLWTNDTPGLGGAQTAPIALDGGNISLTGTVAGANALALGENTLLDASAGAWLNSGGKLKGGKGGNITLGGLAGLDEGQVQSFGFSNGGELTLSTLQDVQVGGQQPVGGNTFWLSDSFFGQGGFSKYTVNASAADADLLIGDAGGGSTVIHPQMQILQARSGFGVLASGNPIQQVAAPALPPDHLRSPASMSFTSGDDLVVFAGATLRTDNPSVAGNKGNISLAAGGQMTIAGSLIAPTGNISATITGATPNFDYDDTLSLFVAETARLLAAGYYALTPSNGGLLDAKVLNGGNITLDGGQRAAVVTRAGSLLDVSGVSGQADVAGADGYVRETLHGAAGSIAVSSRNGLALDGDLRGVATGSGTGGTLALALNGATETPGNVSGHPDHPNGARLLTVTQNRTNRADGLQAGDALDGIVSPGADLLNPDDDVGTGAISAQQISEGGFDRVSLKVSLSNPEDRIVLPSGLNLDVPTALTLDAGLLEVTGNGTARVSAPYISLTSAVGGSAPVAGDARLEVAADFIDLSNSLAVAGVKSTLLDSRTDIRGRGFNSYYPGSLAAPGEIVLRARQVYPVTNGQFRFEATGANSRIEVQPGGATPEPVLSAGGQLILKADEIVQGGALLAPLGQIELDAADRLTLMPDSLTSVSAEGQLIPYGLTGLGGLNMYKPTLDIRPNTDNMDSVIRSQPDKRVSLKSVNVEMRAGARVDISGGGDTLAYEWIEGIGGSKDILGQSNVYAVVPTMQSEYAPFDYNYQIGTDLKPGDAVYLSGIPGLAAGAYILLPGRYALLPGAFMVEASTSRVAPGRAVPQPGGATLVSGYRTTLDGSSRDAAYSTFRVTDGAIFRDNYGTKDYKGPAEYRLTTGNPFFRELALSDGRDLPRLASDAGQLVLDASANLVMDADLLTGKADGARGAQVDIVSGRISVVSAVGAEDGTLQLTADSLNALNAESLLLGGTRSYDSNGMSIVTNADRVTFANDTEHALEASELVAVAKDTLTLDSGAAINTAESKRTTGVTRLHASGDGALLAVSSLNDIEFDRSGASASPATGTLDVVAGASIQAGRSLVLDSTLAATLNGNIDADAGGSATLGANRILLGDSGNETGLKLDDAAIANLGDIARLTLNSRSNIDVYGPVSFGNRNLDLTVNAGGIAGHLADNQIATLTANKLALENSAGAAYLPPTGATGAASSLEVNANSITFSGNAGGKTVIGGFETASLNAAGEVIFKGAGSTEINANQTNIASARIGADTGADYTLAAAGTLATVQAAAPAALPDAVGLGAKLKMVAATGMNLGGSVELPSGQFAAQATAGDLIVANGASIKVASVPVAFDKFTRHTPGGSVTLQADAGNVYTETGSTINVSGGAGGDAGTLKVAATSGSVAVGGTLDGQAVAGQQAGSFVLDTGTLDDFSALNTRLNEGGFIASRDMRVRSGDVAIAAGDTVLAQQFVLSADGGKVDVAGTADASGSNGGSIEIYAKHGLTLKAGGKLLARGEGDSLAVGDGKGAGGSVVLSSDSGTVSAEVFAADGVTRLANAAQIDVSGGKAGDTMGDSGQVTLRAGRTGADNSAFNPVAAAVYNPVTGTVYNSVAATVATASGISTISATVSGFTLTDGKIVAFKPNTQPTGTPRLKIGALTVKPVLKSDGSAPAAAGDVKSGQVNFAVYDSVKGGFKLISNNAGSTVVATVSGLTGLADGSVVAFKPNASLTDTPKLYVNGLGVTGLYKSNGSVAAKTDLASGKVGYAIYDSALGGFKLISGDAGSAMAATVSGLADSSKLTRGDVVAFSPNADTGETPKLHLNGLGLASIQKAGGTAAAASDLKSGKTYLAVYDGTSFQLVSGDASGSLINGSGAVGAGVNVAGDVPAAVTGAGEVRLEAVRAYEKTALDTKAQLQLAADTQAFNSRADAILAGYKTTQDGVAATLAPGVEVRASGGNLTLSSDWNLDATANGTLAMAGAGVLTLKAKGNLVMNGSLNDGFDAVTPAANLASGKSWAYRLVAGADTAAANPLDTIGSTSSGNLTLANGKLIRTGTGDVRIAAGGDLTMGNEASVIYTAGVAADDVTGFDAPALSALTNKNGRTTASYLTDGGDIAIRAQGNITGKTFSGGAQQTVNQWLFRQGGGTGGKDVSWWVRPDLFKQGVAAFGGGNVMVEAGGNITNFSASVPTTARYTDDGSGNFSVDGGGNVLVRAVGDIRSGVYHAGRGDIRLIAGGEIGAASGTFGTALALQDASAEVAAVSGASIETVFNPTLWAQSSNVTNTLGTNGDSSFFLTYGDGSAFRISSLAGDVRIGLEKSGNIKNATGLNNSTTAAAPALELHPGTVEATSFSGNIALRKLVMAPSPKGNLNLLAAGNVSTEGVAYLAMSDADPALVPGIANPLASSSMLGTRMIELRTGHAATPLHADDDEPVTIVAANGSITMVGDDVAEHQSTKGPGLALPKAAYIRADGDVTLNAHIQHSASSDLTSVSAGGDFRLPSGKKNTRLQIAGPGELLVKAGRNVDLADTSGILSVANTTNPALPDQGALLPAPTRCARLPSICAS
ncbi:MAG: filamentous hemagglutinin-like protein, partial [Gallionellaceae bacterium]